MRTFAFLAATGVLAATGAALASGPAADAMPTAAPSVPVARIMAADASLRVDRGDGFEAAGAVAMLRAGDVVMAASDTQIVYADGCSVQVASNTPMSALASSPCIDSASVQRASYQPTGQDDGFNTAYVLGGAALAIAIIALAGNGGDDNNPPFTP